MFTSEYDVFFGAQDQQAKYITGFSAALSSDYTPTAEGGFIYFGSSVSTVSIGSIINLTEGSNTLDCEVKFVDNANNKLFVVPKQDVYNKLNSVKFNKTTTTAKTSGVFQDIFSLPIDLSECTDEWNQYIILVYCDIGISTLSTKCQVRIGRHFPGGLPSEFYSYARYTLGSSTSTFDDKHAYNAAFAVSLRGGSTNVFTIQGAIASTATAKFRHMRITAIKAPTAYVTGYPILKSSSSYEDTNWALTTTSTSDVEAASFSINETGKYLLIASRNLSAGSGVSAQSKVIVGATTYDDVIHLGRGDASDRHTQGFIGYFDTSADFSNAFPLSVSLTLNSVAGSSVSLECPFIAAIKVGDNTELSAAPFMALLGARSLASVSVTSGTSFTSHPSLSLNPVENGFNELKGLEFYSSDISKTGTGFEAAPVFSNDALLSNSPTAYSSNNNNAYNSRGTVGAQRRQRAFWFQRMTWNGYSSGTIKVRAFPTADANSVVCKNSFAAACLEKLPIPAREGIPTDIIGEFEYGAIVSDWKSASSYFTGGSLVTAYKKDLNGLFDDVSRVVLNGENLTKKSAPFLTERNYGSFSFNSDEQSAKLFKTTTSASFSLDPTGFDNISVASVDSIQVGQKVLVINPNNKKKFFHGVVTIINGSNGIGVRRLDKLGDIRSGFTVGSGWIVTGVEGKYLYVNMPEGVSPYAESTGNRIVAIGKKRFSREITEVYDDGIPIATDTRMTKLPTVSQNLDIRGSQIKSTQSFNSIELSNGDGIYDNLPGRYVVEGMGIKIYRSWRNYTDSRLTNESKTDFRKRKILYKSLGYYETLIDGVQSAPDFSPESYKINVLPKIMASSKPLTEFTCMTFSGSDNASVNRTANFPIVYGYARRVEAKRITPIVASEKGKTGDDSVVHFYRVACHEIHSVVGAYARGISTYDFSQWLTINDITDTTYTSAETKELLKRGIVGIKNKYITNIQSYEDEFGPIIGPDSIFLDIIGRTNNGETEDGGGSALIWPGEIAEHFLKCFPCGADLAVANKTTLTTMATSYPKTGVTVQLSDNALVQLKVADRTGFLPGDRIKVTDTTASQVFPDGTYPYFWAAVTKAYNGSGSEKIIEAWPLLEAGDSIGDGRSYPQSLSPAVSASNVTVERYVSPSLYATTTYLTNGINDKEPDPDQEFPLEVNSTSGFTTGSEIQLSYGSNKFTARVSSVSSSTIMRISPYPKLGDNLDGKIDYPASSSTYIKLLATSPSAMQESSLDTGSLRQMDHSWRKKLIHNYGSLQEDTVEGTFVFTDNKAAIKDFIDKFSKTFFSYSYVNRAGKVSFKPVGFEEFNLVKNPGFESDVYSSNGASIVYPYLGDDGYNGETSGGVPGSAAGSAALIVANRSNSRPAYEGKRSMKITGGNSLALSSRSSNVYTSVLLTKSGWYYLSCKSLADSSSSQKRHLRMSISLPGDGYREAITVPATSVTAASSAAVVWLQADKSKTDFTDAAKVKANIWLQADKMNQDYANGGSVFHIDDYSANQYTFNVYPKWNEATTSGMTQWHKSETLTTTGAISSWADSSTDATPPLVQTTPQRKPSVASAIKNGKSGLAFTGSQVLEYSTQQDLGTTHSIIIVISPEVTTNDFTIFANSNGTTYLKWIKSTGNLVYCLNSTQYTFAWTPVSSKYYVIAINRYSTSQVRILVNGTQLNDRTISNTTDVFAIKYVGATDTNGTNGLTGKIMEIVFQGSDANLVTHTVLAMGHKYMIDLEPTPSFVTAARNNLAVLSFNSTGYGPGSTTYNYMAIDNNNTDAGIDLGSVHTISMVFSPTTIVANQYLLGETNYVGSSGQSGSYLAYANSGTVTYRAGNTSGNAVTFSTTFTAGNWYIVTLVRDESQVSLYVNGSQVGTTQTIPTAGELTSFKVKTIAAANLTGEIPLSCQLGEVFITKQPLSSNEKAGLEYYLSQKWNISGPSYPADENCYQLLDYSGNGNHFTIDGYWNYYQQGCSGWWKVDSISGLSDGDSVASWSDSSGNNLTLSQATGSAKPTYVSYTDGGINGKPVITFDGTSDYLTLSSSLDLGTQHIITIVFRYNASLGANYASNTVRNLIYGSNSTASIDLFSGTINYNVNDGTASGSTSWTPTKNKWYILSFKRLTASSNTVAVYLNGARLSNITLSGANTANSFTFNTIGKQNSSYTTPYFGGQIAEIVTTTTDVDDLKVFQTQAYLSRKYNITDQVPMPKLTYNTQNGLSTLTIDSTGGIGSSSSTSYYDNLSSASTSTDKNASINLGTSHTISVLFKSTSFSSDVYICRGETKESLIYISGTGTALTYKLTNTLADTLSVTTSALSTNRWYMLTVVRSSVYVYFYLDGKLIGTRQAMSNNPSVPFYLKSLACKNQASLNDSATGLDGEIAEFYATDRALTDAQRAELEDAIMYKWGLSYSNNESTSKWVKNELLFYLAPGEAGTAILRFYPQFNSYTTESHYIDNVELYSISGVATDSNADFKSVDNEDENYYEIEVPYLVNSSDDANKYTMTVRDFDAYGLSTFMYSEAKGALPSSGILKVENINLKNADSARGIGAAYARYFGRVRQVAKITVLDMSRIPCVGDKICIKMTRSPVSTDDDNVWTIISVQVSGDMARKIDITAIRQVDPWIDRNKRTTY
jgi:hypothetical protein